ncbi:response regulator transcription factor [candidate division KSB1 bacterium]
MIKILIADDSELIRKRVVSMLKEVSSDFSITEAENAQDALKISQDLKPDVVILDIRMPGNGMNVIEKIKKISNSLKVIMLTNYTIEQYRTKCFEMGADHFFNKTDGLGQIIEIVNDLIKEQANNNHLN